VILDFPHVQRIKMAKRADFPHFWHPQLANQANLGL
jgi:hypothetical protein